MSLLHWSVGGSPPPLSRDFRAHLESENRDLRGTTCPSEDSKLPVCPGIEAPMGAGEGGRDSSSPMWTGSAHRDGGEKSSKFLPSWARRGEGVHSSSHHNYLGKGGLAGRGTTQGWLLKLRSAFF